MQTRKNHRCVIAIVTTISFFSIQANGVPPGRETQRTRWAAGIKQGSRGGSERKSNRLAYTQPFVTRTRYTTHFIKMEIITFQCLYASVIDSSNDTIVSAYLIKLGSDTMVMEKPWSVLDQVYCWTSVGQQTKSPPILSTKRGIEWMEIFLWGFCRASNFEFRCFQLLFNI